VRAGPRPVHLGLLAPGETSGEGFFVMVTPTLGCSIQADVKLKILYGKLSKYLLAGSGSPRRASIVRCSGEKTMSIIRI
jgi:hypothetical protein